MEIWDILLKRFTGLYFASSVAIGDGGGDAGGTDGGDGGDSGGGDDGGDSGDGADESVPETDGGDDESSLEDSEGEEEGTEEEGESTEGEERGAKKTLTPEQQAKRIEKGLNELRKIDPITAQLVRKEHFQNREFREIFATPQEARQGAELVEAIGGQRGYERAKEELGSYARELDQMAKGDPRAIEDLAGDFPKGFAKLVPHALDKLRTIDSATYERTLSRHMAGAMAEKGFTRSAERLVELIADGKAQPAFDLAKQMSDWIKGVEQFGKTQPADAQKEEMSEVERERAAVNQEKDNIFRGQVASEVTQTMNSIISRHLNPLLKGKNLTLEQKKSLASGIMSRISGSLQRNENYQERLKALLAERDGNGAKRYVGSQVARIAKKATDAEWAARGFNLARSKPAARAGGNGAGAPSVGRKPSADQIDWTKDRSKMRYMAGEATLKKEFGGKIVRWDRNAL